MKIKLCGFTEEKSLQTAIACDIDFIGFVFHEGSIRNISVENAKTLAKNIPSHVATVAVTVNASIDKLKSIAKAINPDFFQLHGDENIEKIKEIHQNFPKIGIIKAFYLKNAQDLQNCQKFTEFVDFFLFDGKIAGSGQVFNWEILQNFHSSKPYFLSGGLNCQNIDQAITKTKAEMIDVSSGIEEIKGIKSSKLIKEFAQKAKNAN